jgi:hypothetical protein
MIYLSRVLSCLVIATLLMPLSSSAAKHGRKKERYVPSGPSYPLCRDYVTIYLDRSGSMFSRQSDQTRFHEALGSIESIFMKSGKFQQSTITLKTFGLAVEPNVPSFDLGDEKGQVGLGARIDELRRWENKNNDKTNVAAVLADMMQSDKEREVFVVVSDFVHQKTDKLTVDEWRNDLARLDGPARRRGVSGLVDFLRAKDKIRTLLLFNVGVGADELEKWEVQSRVTEDLLTPGYQYARAFPVNRLVVNSESVEVEAALRSVTIAVQRLRDRFEIRLRNQSCQNPIPIGGIRFGSKYIPWVKRYLKDTDRTEILDSELGSQLEGRIEAYVLSDKNGTALSNEAHFSLKPTIELVGAVVHVKDRDVSATVNVRGQPPFKELDLDLTVGDVLEWRSGNLPDDKQIDLGALNLDQVKDYQIKLKSVSATAGLCGEREPVKTFVAFKSGQNKFNRLRLNRDASAEDSSHRFFESAAIPGALFIGLLVIMAFKRVRLSYLVENLHLFLTVLLALFGIFHYATPFISRLEVKVTAHDRAVPALLMGLTWVLILVVCKRVRYSEGLSPVTLEWYAGQGQLTKHLRRSALVRALLVGTFAVAAVACTVAVMVSYQPLNDCSYSSDGVYNASEGNEVTLPGGE